MRPNDGRATNAVLRNLDKETDHLWFAWESMPYDSLEAFRESAQSYLGDKSELGSKTLENADWPKVYEYFKELKAGGQPVFDFSDTDPRMTSIPEKARELRKSLDRNNMPTTYHPAKRKGGMHMIYVYPPLEDRILIMVDETGYSVYGEDLGDLTKTDDTVKAMEAIRALYRRREDD